MNIDDFVFRLRVVSGRPFRRVWPYEADKMADHFEKAVKSSLEIEEYNNTNGTVVDSRIVEFAKYMQITGPNSNFAHGVLLGSIAEMTKRRNLRKPIRALDVGTARGFSAACMATKLETPDLVVSLDHLPHRKEFFWGTVSDIEFGKLTREELVQRVGAGSLPILFLQQTSSDYMQRNNQRHQMIFLDGQHDYGSVSAELEWSFDVQSPGDYLLVDDYMTHYPGIDQAVRDHLLSSRLYKTRRIVSSSNRSYAFAERLGSGTR